MDSFADGNLAPSEVTRHFTATTYVVRGDAVLLHRHRRQGIWLPPGGHIERDELPSDAARREIEEETGLQLRLHSEAEADRLAIEMGAPVVAQPAFILVEDINPYHQHIDFTYYARAGEGQEPDEGSGFGWFTPDELDRPDVPQNVRAGACRAIDWARSEGTMGR
jgi:8-oxo-dGTP pyrophosphatase MutT (NUDIX family)